MVVLCRFEPRRSDLLRRGLFLDLLLDEGQTIGALIDCRVAFVGADADFIEGTVILAAAVVAALSNVTFDAVIRFFSAINVFCTLSKTGIFHAASSASCRSVRKIVPGFL